MSLMGKTDSMQKQVDNVKQKDGHPNKEQNRNASDQKHCNKNEECL